MVSNREVRQLIETCNDIKVSLGRVEEKIISIHACNGQQNERIGKCEEIIEDVKVSSAVTGTKLWILLFIGGLFGGVISGVILKLI